MQAIHNVRRGGDACDYDTTKVITAYCRSEPVARPGTIESVGAALVAAHRTVCV
jgi:hypothetical protein